MAIHVNCWWGENKYMVVYVYDPEEGELVPSNQIIEREGVFEEGRGIHVNPGMWSLYVEIGKRFGWQPLGTSLEKLGEGNRETLAELGGTNDYKAYDWHFMIYKVVTAEDAAAWADALERALPELAAGPYEIDKQWFGTSYEWFGTEVCPSKLVKFQFDRQQVSKFIEFLRKGKFQFAIFPPAFD